MQGDFFSIWKSVDSKRIGERCSFRRQKQPFDFARPVRCRNTRVWGIRDGAQPLLIGVAQPDGDGLTIDRTMSKQYLSSLGYWPALPEQYVADTQPPQKRVFFSHDACFRCVLRESEIEIQDDAAYMMVSCCFSPQKKFIFSGIFSFCRIENGRARLIWDKKRDCPVWTVPKENDAVT